MQAIVYAGPGDLLVQDWPEPSVNPGQALVEVAHLGICGSDLHLWAGGFERANPPVVVGHEFCGRVVDAGTGNLAVGTRVAVEPIISCGRCDPCTNGTPHVCQRLGILGIDVDGGGAERVAVAAHRLHALPEALAMRDAVLTEPTAVAAHMVQRAGLEIGDRVLVCGGGPIGVLLAFVARASGAADVIISEPAEYRRNRILELGLRAVDPAAGGLDPFTTESGDPGFDVVFEVSGSEAGLRAAVNLCRVRGTVLLGGLAHGPVPVAVTEAIFKELSLIGSRVYEPHDFGTAIRLLESGSIPAEAIITREVPMADAVAGAYEPLRNSPHELKIIITHRAEGS